MRKFKLHLLAISFYLCFSLNVGIAQPSNSSPKCLYPFPLKLRMQTSNAVFSGQVLEIKKREEFEEVRFKVLRSWKNIHSDKVVLFNYPNEEAAISYQVGESYLVFAYGSENQLATGACPQVELLRNARGTIRQLERWQRQNKYRKRRRS